MGNTVRVIPNDMPFSRICFWNENKDRSSCMHNSFASPITTKNEPDIFFVTVTDFFSSFTTVINPEFLEKANTGICCCISFGNIDYIIVFLALAFVHLWNTNGFYVELW